jgi:hypothetical protein
MNATSPAVELIERVRSVTDLEFFRVPAEPGRSELPLLIWRYAKKEGAVTLIPQISAIIESAIQHQRVEWQFRYSGRNWVLAPKRFHELEESGRFRQYPEILRHLESTDPDLTRLSNIDLAEIVKNAATALRELTHDRLQPH